MDTLRNLQRESRRAIVSPVSEEYPERPPTAFGQSLGQEAHHDRHPAFLGQRSRRDGDELRGLAAHSSNVPPQGSQSRGNLFSQWNNPSGQTGNSSSAVQSPVRQRLSFGSQPRGRRNFGEVDTENVGDKQPRFSQDLVLRREPYSSRPPTYNDSRSSSSYQGLPSSPSFVSPSRDGVNPGPTYQNHCRTPNQSSPFFEPDAQPRNRGESSPLARLPSNSYHRNHTELNTADDNYADERTQPVDSSEAQETFKYHESQQNRSEGRSNTNTPLIQGIRLVSLHPLPDRFRAIFPFPLFNAVQSRCFQTAYETDENLVVSAPTSSGKTAILEIAICRLAASHHNGDFKIIYMAPTKSLCSERRRDWSEKFAKLGLKCEELTGDTDPAHLREAAIADIIVTTPEKWDSMTRKWTDHKKLLQLVKLFLVDEVHIVKEKRGATLEAVVSRMKSAEFEVRFIALSATVPNSEDIAAWLGRSPTRQHLPARLENFGEEFRPVKLQKHVFGLPSRANDFAFDKACDSRLWELIAKHSSKKPIMIFCCTRNSAQQTAELLASTWVEKSSQDRFWVAPSQMLQLQDAKLRNFTQCGVAFHHAGLASTDRIAIEKGFLTRQISVICCTSTLAVGVNLPCHLVIIKNTMTWQETGLKEYADLEMMQMLGRAGRPQFDKDAVAVIITKVEKVEKYRKLIQGQELLESCLHLNLIEHLNAEISLRTVSDLMSAKKWLSGTFLSVRLGLNPAHYQFDANGIFKNLDERIEHICQRDINLLQQADLVVEEARLRCTLFGHAMSRYYVNFKTMKLILGLPPNAKMSEILSVVAQAEEFHEIRFKGGEKSLYRSLNSAQGIKYPIKVDFALAAHKRSIIMQAELGGVEFPAEDQFNKHRMQYQQDRAIILAHANRLMRCIIDCLLAKADAPAARHALELARSLAAHVWDDSPLQMRQIEGIGPVSVRKLAAAGINSLETLEQTEASRIADILGKQRVTGESVLLKVRNFPKVRVSVKIMGQEIKAGKPPKINIKAEVGFVNEIVPFTFNKKSIFVCFIAERSDGHLLDFRRFSAKKLANAEEVCLSAELLDARQHITCYVMCDEIAGTVQYAELKPRLPGHVFPPPLPTPLPDLQTSRATVVATRTGRTICSRLDVVSKSSEDFLDDDLDDAYLAEAEAQEADFRDVDDSPQSHAPLRGLKGTRALATNARAMENDEANEPEQLNNGKWACNHKCKDKTVCKHLCCREGLDKKPKPKKLTVTNESQGDIDTEGISKGSKSTSIVSVNAIRRSTQRSINEPEIVDLSHGQPARSHSMEDCGHESSSLTNPRSNEITLPAAFKPSTARPAHREVSSDYGDDQWMDDLPPLSELLEGPSILPKGNASKRQPEKDIFDLNPTSDDVEMPDPTMPELQKKKPLIYEPTNVETPLSEEGVGFEYRSGDDQCLTIDEMEEAQFPMDDDIEQPHLEEEVQSSNLPSGSSSSTLKQQLGSSESRRDSPPTQAESENLFLHTSSDIPNDAAALAPPASHQTPTSLTNHEKRTLELEDEYPASPSLPPAKRIKEGVEISTRAPNHLTDGKGVINADLYDVYALPVGHRLRPWEDMSGVDLNLLLEYVDHVDFV